MTLYQADNVTFPVQYGPSKVRGVARVGPRLFLEHLPLVMWLLSTEPIFSSQKTSDEGKMLHGTSISAYSKLFACSIVRWKPAGTTPDRFGDHGTKLNLLILCCCKKWHFDYFA